MIPRLRRAYNAAITEERYERILTSIETQTRCRTGVRICETPLFLDERLTAELVNAANAVIATVTSAHYLRESHRMLPAGLVPPAGESIPGFLSIDFALALDETGRITPRLTELQAFPSLFGLLWLLEAQYRSVIPIDWAGLSPYFNGITPETYGNHLREVILGEDDPTEVVLLDIDPTGQKTYVDFAATRRLLGIAPVDARDISVRNGELYYRRDGGTVRIRRVYNRIVFEDLMRHRDELHHLFFTDPASVTWIGHPTWFVRVSKFALPFMDSQYCPQAWFLSDLDSAALPEDLENYVLKPLLSVGGRGVQLGPVREQVLAMSDPENYVLQRRIRYAPIVPTAEGMNSAEIRLMFTWTDRPFLVNNFVRFSRGPMMGIDFNQHKLQSGVTLAFHQSRLAGG